MKNNDWQNCKTNGNKIVILRFEKVWEWEINEWNYRVKERLRMKKYGF